MNRKRVCSLERSAKLISNEIDWKQNGNSKWKMQYYFWFYRKGIMRGTDVKTSNKLVEIGKFSKTHSARLNKKDIENISI